MHAGNCMNCIGVDVVWMDFMLWPKEYDIILCAVMEHS